MRNLLASTQVPVIVLGSDLLIRWFTPRAESALLLDASHVGRSITDVDLGLDIDNLEARLRDVLATGSVQEIEVHDRHAHWYSLRLQPAASSGTAIDGVALVLVDVHEMRRAREYAEDIVRAVAEPLIVLDDSLRVLTANAPYYEMFGTTPEEAEGQVFDALCGGRWNTPDLQQALENLRRTGTGIADLEVPCEIDGLGTRIVLVNGRRLTGRDDFGTSIVLTLKDITERKQLEADLRLRVAQLADADRSKDEFLAMLAHELRNPLAALRNACHLLDDATVTTEALGLARGIIDRQLGHMARMIDDLIDIARITQGKIQVRRQIVDVSRVMHDAVQLARPGFEARGQTLTLRQPPEPVYLSADPVRLEQIFGNLLHNASKYTASGGRIWFTTELASDPDKTPTVWPDIIITVGDNGNGIAPDMLGRVFEPFVQIAPSNTDMVAGLGLGLTLVRRLVELHGGHIEARSAGPGHGSEFIVRLPTIGPPASASTETASSDVATAPGPVRGLRVLIVDDNLDAAESGAILLQMAGHTVRVAHDGPHALREAREFSPDVVLLDIGLPGMTGYEVATYLRQHPASARTYLIALTGYGQEHDRQRSRAAGFDHHLVKPVDPRALQHLLSHLPRA